MTAPKCLRLTPAQAREAFGPHGHVEGLYVMLNPPKPGGTLWAMSRIEGKGEGRGMDRSREGKSEGQAAIPPDTFPSDWMADLYRQPRQALVVQDCTVRGAAEWDAANRVTAAGVVERTVVTGSRIVMDCHTGKGKVRFGPSSIQQGAQALESIQPEPGAEIQVEADPNSDIERQGAELRLRWRGLAGAGVGLAHGLARAPNLLWTDYPEIAGSAGMEKLMVGGNRELVVETVVPTLTRLMVGIDDTDTPERGATWVLGLDIARQLESSLQGLKVLEHRLIQLWSGVQEKTSNCVALGLSLALPPHQVSRARDIILETVALNATSPEAAVALFEGLRVSPEVVDLCHAARRELITLAEVRAVASGARVVLEPVVGQRGLIGAVSAIGGLDLGPDVAAPAKASARTSIEPRGH